MRSLVEAFPLIDEVCEKYQSTRALGSNREQAVSSILSHYHAELMDQDDSRSVILGLAKGTAKKQEMTDRILPDAEEACAALVKQYPDLTPSILKFRQKYCVSAAIGPEAVYRKRKPYKPDWQIGDAFLYTLQGDNAKKHGLEGWSVIVRKTGEYLSPDEKWYQLVYLSIAQPGFIPKTDDEMNALGYIPFQPRKDGNSFVFKASIRCTGKNMLKQYELTPIGNFPSILPPKNEICDPDDLATPLFPKMLSKNGEELCRSSLETQAIRCLKTFGIIEHI